MLNNLAQHFNRLYTATYGRMVTSKSSKIAIISHKRSVRTDKPVGHAHKVLNSLTKHERTPSLSMIPQGSPSKPSTGINNAKSHVETPSSPLGKGPATVGNTGGISSVKGKIHPGIQPGSHSFLGSFKGVENPTFEVRSSLPFPFYPQIPSNIKPELREEYEKELTLANKDNKALFQALSQRWLFDLEQSKAKSAFYQHILENPNTPKEYVILSREGLKEPAITIALLRVDENTLILSGKQMHPIVLYTSPDNKNIAWSYLTSENDSKTIELSPYQPFSSKIAKQFLRITRPFLVKDTDIEPLPKDQDAIAKLYLKEPSVRAILEEKISENLGSPQVLETYTGLGFVKEDLIAGLASYELDQIKKAEKYFNDYKNNKNTYTAVRLKVWLKKHEVERPHSYKYLIQLIKQYENK